MAELLGKRPASPFNIAGGIMDNKKLGKIEAELRQLKVNCRDINSETLESIAGRLGRVKSKTRTTEPTFVRESEPHLSPPLSIPNRKSLAIGTARSVIAALLDDVDEWKQHLLLTEQESTPDDDSRDER